MKGGLRLQLVKHTFLFTLVLGAGLIFGTSTAHACTNPGSLPAGFANPCPIFDAEPTQVTQSGSVALTAAPTAAKQYISQTFYVYGSSWQPLSFSGTFKKGYTTSTATYTLSSSQLSQLPPGTIYLAEWDWTWSAAQQCFVGPSSTLCNQGSWRLQEFTLTGSGGGGAPLTYGARTDLCETGSESGCLGLGLSFLGRNSTDQNGVYTPTDIAPSIGGLYGANDCVTDPDFHEKICRVTDYSMGKGFNAGSSGGAPASDGSAFLVNTVGSKPILFAFSNDSNMISTETDIGGVTQGGSATTFADSGPTFASIDPKTMYEFVTGTDGNGKPTVILNQVTINENGSPSQWTLSRQQIFDFEEGNPGHPPGTCLKFYPTYPDGTAINSNTPFIPTWTGGISISGDDTAFQISLSDHGQNGSRGVDKKGVWHYGATFVVAYNKGKGCRVLNTFGDENGNGPMTITGDWGDVGTALDGSGAPLGQSGGNPLLDTLYLHGSGPTPNSLYSSMSGSNIPQSQYQGSCTYSGKQQVCENYFWETATRNVRPITNLAGHATKGFLYAYKGKRYSSVDYHDPSGTHIPLLPVSISTDQHGMYNNADPQDDQPIFLTTSNVCGQAPGQGQGMGNCDPQYNAPFYDEVIAVENQAAHGGAAQHCNYGSGPTACVYRFAHTFNTGTNWNFYAQNAEGGNSPTGKYLLFPSDWNLTLGCTNGQPSGCLNNISSTLNSYCVNNAGQAPCPRSDVFVMQLQ
jgi:hypothetical protein